ncbi:MAG: hypothetical protein L0196_03245 [candidate division Zixibacteria bacterium]|nr:hypothetical protein [candidate division Zixibacteria bacterium]
MEALPKILKGKDWRELISLWLAARRKKKTRLVMAGAHVLKCGLSPLLVDLAEKGFISALALHGAGAIHDLEIAFFGQTSEEVDETLEAGRFGMVRETAELYAAAVYLAARRNIGLGEAFGAYIDRAKAPYKKYSLLYNFHRLGLPAAVFVAFGTDTVHQHPNFPAGETGEATWRDFKVLAAAVAGLNEGGLVANFGSAVILPEVFLKALSAARNVSGPVKNFTAANFDMIQHYRPRVNLLSRPTLKSGRAFAFTGHHEIMLPLLAASLKSYDRYKRK